MKKALCITLAAIIGCSVFAGCNSTKKSADAENGDKINLPIGAWVRKDENPTAYEQSLKNVEEFEKQNPQYKIEPVEWSYDLSTFLPKAAAGELPICYDVAFTEVKRIVSSGYAADVTKYLKEYGYEDSIKKEVWDLLTYDGKRSFFPTRTYIESLFINKNLFKQAGLVNEDGSVKIPQTYDEMIEYAGIIKQKTGKYGYAIPTTNREGGWAFMNIAWSYGTEFMKQDENGKWKATFDSPECAEALNVLKRARFEYDAVPPNVLLNPSELGKLFASDQLAMYIIPPPQNNLFKTYGMNPDDIVIAKTPAGSKSRSTLLGGALLAFASGYTDEQYEGTFKWQEFIGNGPKLKEGSEEKLEQGYQTQKNDNKMVGVPQFTFWRDDLERIKKDRELQQKYATVNLDNVKDFADTEGVTIKPEEPTNCQQLYEVLDTCIQKAYESKDSDINKILKESCDFFQRNYLDKSN